jgi:hypothetical protein
MLRFLVTVLLAIAVTTFISVERAGADPTSRSHREVAAVPAEPSADCLRSAQCAAGFRWAINNEINEYRLCNVSGEFGKGCRELVTRHLDLQDVESMFSRF